MRRPTQVTMAVLLSLFVTPARGLDPVPGIDYLNDRLPIPDSELFDEAAYIESGVGLSYGVDKRLLYFSGQYEEAAQRFELAVRQFRKKAEIWVFLSRAYFYTKSPEEARRVLERAEAIMPDLAEKLWRPLVASLEWEIRRRAVNQQAQVDFYSPGQEEYLSLFRLYSFLKDYDGARRVVDDASGRARSMLERARMVSGSSRRAQVEQSRLWMQLAQRLDGELKALGVASPRAAEPAMALPDPQGPEEADEDERIRLLQLRVDYYRTKVEDYQELFQAYLDRGQTQLARGVLESLDRHLFHLDVRASVAPTVTEQAEIEEEMRQLRFVHDTLESQLPAPPPTADGAGR